MNIINEYEKEHPINQYKRYNELKEKMEGEFRKISQNDEFNKCINQFIKVDIHFDNWKHLKIEAYPEGNNNKIIEYVEKNLDEFFNNYCIKGERYIKDGNEFANFLDMKLDSLKTDSIYWCFYLGSYHPIFAAEQKYHEFIVIRIDSKKLESYFRFEGKIHPFIEPLKRQLTTKCKLRNYDEIYRRIVTDMDILFYNAINDFNQISLLKYEGKVNNGVIIYSNKEDEDIWDICLKFENKIKLNEYKKIRKLLEVSSGTNALLLNKNFEAFAFGAIKSGQDNYKITFIEELSWKVEKNNEDYIELVKLQPVLPSKNNNDKEIMQILSKVFTDDSLENRKKLLNIIKKVKQQKKGTTLVIAENAEEESTRLNSCGIKVKAIEIKDEIVNLVTSIDGALLIDTKGVCYSIGVILDGNESGEGDSSRGARYNSALRYVRRQQEENKKCLIVVVSEDGYINCIFKCKE